MISRILTMFIAWLFIPVITNAAYFDFEKTNISDTANIELLVYIVPEQGERVYTGSMHAKYFGGQVISFEFNKDFLPLYNKFFNKLDNKNKEFIKTAGIPGGIIEKTLFAKITFIRDTHSQEFVLQIEPTSTILDAINENKLNKFQKITVNNQGILSKTFITFPIANHNINASNNNKEKEALNLSANKNDKKDDSHSINYQLLQYILFIAGIIIMMSALALLVRNTFKTKK